MHFFVWLKFVLSHSFCGTTNYSQFQFDQQLFAYVNTKLFVFRANDLYTFGDCMLDNVLVCSSQASTSNWNKPFVINIHPPNMIRFTRRTIEDYSSFIQFFIYPFYAQSTEHSAHLIFIYMCIRQYFCFSVLNQVHSDRFTFSTSNRLIFNKVKSAINCRTDFGNRAQLAHSEIFSMEFDSQVIYIRKLS